MPIQGLPRPANGIGITCVKMKVLFVGSGNHGKISPILKSQGDSLASDGAEIDYFLIKGKGLKGYLRQMKPLKRYVKKNRFDVIHAHYSMSAFAVSLANVRPVVVSLMGSDVKATRLYKMLIRFFACFVLHPDISVCFDNHFSVTGYLCVNLFYHEKFALTTPNWGCFLSS